MDSPIVHPGPRVRWWELLEALRTLLQRPEPAPRQSDDYRRMVDPWEDDQYLESPSDAGSQRCESSLAPCRPDHRFSVAATTTLEVTTRLMALRVPPAVAIASGLIAGSLALLNPGHPHNP